jgi:hypothetical protein
MRLASQCGVLVNQSNRVVTLLDVCFAGMVSTAERRQPGLAGAPYNLFLEAIIVRNVSKCKELVACPRGSSRNRVTTSASQTTVRVSQSMPQNPDSPQGVCLGHGSVVDRSERTSPKAAVPMSTVALSPHRHVQVLNAMISKTGAASTSTGGRHWSVSAIATGGRSCMARLGTRLFTDAEQRSKDERVGKDFLSYE